MSSPKTDQQSLCLEFRGQLLQLHFRRDSDRWSHSLGIGEHDILSSIEGTAGDDWPVSPVFQELQIEDRGDDQVALLVGMAGKSYWSGSVSPVVENDQAGWEFDIACLAKLPPQWLGTSYSQLNKQTDSRLNVQPVTGCDVSDSPTGAITLCYPQTDESLPGTFCWKYRILLDF